MTDRAIRPAITVEVAWVTPEHQVLRRLDLDPGATVAHALAASRIADELSIDIDALAVGIWSKRCTRDAVLHDGDRVELYRPLKVDPKEARRRRAAQKAAD